MTAYETLLRLAYRKPADQSRYLTPVALGAYGAFEQASAAEQSFRFELWRLGIAASLLHLVAELGDFEMARRAADVLHKALNTARSPEDIDQQIGRETTLFDQLYTNLYVNDDGEELLDLFARTLDADAPALLETVQNEAVEIARDLDFEAEAESDED